MEINPTCNGPLWTREEDKAFENALASYSGHICPWEKIAAAIPGKTIDEIKNHFEVLKSDVSAIDSGDIPLPDYTDCEVSVCLLEQRRIVMFIKKNLQGHIQIGGEVHLGRKKNIGCSIRAASPSSTTLVNLSRNELFLYGLDKYGKGDWRSISRHCVKTRTPTQVASHAQKYFKRSDEAESSRKRTSIHDITDLDDGEFLKIEAAITGQPSSEGGETSRGETREKTRTSENDSAAIKLLSSPGTKKGDVSTAQRLSTEQTVGASAVIDLNSMPTLYGISFSEGPSTQPMIGASDGGLISVSMPNTHGISFSEGPSTRPRIRASDHGLTTPCMPNRHGIPISHGQSTEQIGASGVGLGTPHHLQGVSIPKGPHRKRIIGAGNVDYISGHQVLSMPQAPATGHMFGAADVGFKGNPFPTHQHTMNPQAPRTEEMMGATSFCAPLVYIQQSIPTLQGPIPQQTIAYGGAGFSNSLVSDTGEGFDVEKYLVDIEPSEPDIDPSLLESPNDPSQIQEPVAVLRSFHTPNPEIYGFECFILDTPLG